MLSLAPVSHTMISSSSTSRQVVAAVKNGSLKRLPVKNVLVGLDDILYPLINRVQIPVGDNDLGLASAWVLSESGTMGTDSYF